MDGWTDGARRANASFLSFWHQIFYVPPSPKKERNALIIMLVEKPFLESDGRETNYM